MRLHWRVSLTTAGILLALVVALLLSTLLAVHRYVGQSMEQQVELISTQLLDAQTSQILSMLDFASGSLQMPLYTLDIDLIGEVVYALESQGKVQEVVVYDAKLSVLHDGNVENVGQPLASALNRLIAYTSLSLENSPDEISAMLLARLSQGQQSESSVLLSAGTMQLFLAPVVLNDEGLGGLLLLVDQQEVEQLSQMMQQDTALALAKGIKVGSLLAIALAFLWVGIALMILVYVLIQLTAPLRLMANEMNKVAKGDSTGKLNIQRNDEIGELATAFNDMVSQLNVTMVSRNEYRQLANLDNLTGLSNRRHCELVAEGYLKGKLSAEELVAMVLVDLDDFKRINDTKGHNIGDEILKAVAQRLNSCLRSNDIAARVGGDEFMVFLTGFSNHQQMKHLVERILYDLTAQPYQVMDVELWSYCSIGLAIAPEHGNTYEHLSKCADEALYVAKRSGKNQYRFYNQQLSAKRSRQQQIQQALGEALENSELYLHYQPQLELHSGKVIGCEALARWQSPTYGAVSPAEFIPIAESSGLIIQLGRWALEESLRQLSYWRAQGQTELCVAVNLSSRQFADDGLIPFIDTLLARYALPGKYVELEITESMVIDDTERVLHKIEQLRTRGVQLAIDDFGTGYSSLSYLKQIPVHRLKIDRSFLAQDRSEQHDIAIIEAIIRMGQALDLSVIMEGIETEEQAQLLCDLGCDQGQGFYFARPMPGDTFLSFCRQSSAIDEKPEKAP